MKQHIKIYGDAVLREKAQHVDRVDDGIRRLVNDLLETMYANKGLGLAAEQVGRTESVCVVDIPPGVEGDVEPGSESASGVPMPLVLINPEIEAASGEQVAQEGCLSFPELYVSVKRAANVKVKYLSLDNREAFVEADGLLSRAIQHEMDHLNGMLLVDRISAVKKVGIAGKLKRLRKMSAAAE